MSLSILLAACGGSGNESPSTEASGNPATTRLLPYPPYIVGDVKVAPADGATISGFVRIEVQGYRMGNVELLPPTGYNPKYGVFNVYDGYEFNPEQAWLDLDTTKLPNGPITVRISGFEAPSGQPGRELVIMAPRTWNVNNPSPLAPLSATVASAPANGATISGTTRLEVRGTGLANVELLPASGYAPKLGVFNVSPDRTYAWLDFDSRSVADGIKGVRISAFNVTQGQSNATEVVAMPARQWNVQNGSAPPPAVPFTAMVTAAPAHGSTVTGMVHLEVRGSGLANIELLPANGYTPKLGTFSTSVDKTRAWLDFDPKVLPIGVNEVRISAFSKPAGQPNAQEIAAMPARQWNIRY